MSLIRRLLCAVGIHKYHKPVPFGRMCKCGRTFYPIIH